jgi:hypothetical protein
MFVHSNKNTRHRFIYGGLPFAPIATGSAVLVVIAASVGLTSGGHGRGLVSVGHVRGFTR